MIPIITSEPFYNTTVLRQLLILQICKHRLEQLSKLKFIDSENFTKYDGRIKESDNLPSVLLTILRELSK